MKTDLALSYPWALRVERHDDSEWFPPPRDHWGPGPWQYEPDLVEWRAAVAPYPLLIVRGGMGALCGYVGVPVGHPLHGRPRALGLNWAGPCGGHRIPTGEPPECWWLGFDCGHAGQYPPVMVARERWLSELVGMAPSESLCRPLFDPAGYVTIDECRLQVEALAVVLQAATNTPLVLEALTSGSGLTG
jgi:hypothetical protein